MNPIDGQFNLFSLYIFFNHLPLSRDHLEWRMMIRVFRRVITSAPRIDSSQQIVLGLIFHIHAIYLDRTIGSALDIFL